MGEIFPPLFSIQFDDGWLTDYTEGFSYMESKGIPYGTSWYIAELYSKMGFLEWRHIIEMKSKGWDIQCHFSYVGLTEAELRAQFERHDNFWNYRYFSLDHHTAHATPNEERALGLSIAPEYRKTASVGGEQHAVQSYEDMDFYGVKRSGFDMRTVGRFDAVCAIIDEAVAENKILIAYVHKLTEDPIEGECSIDYFQQMIDHALSTGITFMNISQVYRKVLRWREKNL